MASNWARFWAVDLHVHTPASGDARDEDFGTAADIVQKALDAGLDAIAVTDHNTVAWCAEMTQAAKGTSLIVLPGFELSTPQGHLLGIWEQGTTSPFIEDVLIRVGIERAHLGGLDVVAAKTITECAEEIMDKGGVAIAAHIDKDRGILTQPVQTHVNHLLADPRISAFEFVRAETPAKVIAKLGDARNPALLQGSDAYDPALSRHSATGIGGRRTWIKAARPDLCGLRYALKDPDLRVTLSDPAVAAPHPTIDSLSISGGFLSGASLGFSPDLNCLLGGTGAGKSLVLEALRFVLDQQVDKALFSTIRDEVDRRLESALCEGTEVTVEISTASDHYRVRRTYRSGGSQPVVEQGVDGEWVQIGHAASSIMALAAFSQGEILEYARQPVGRVGLVDAKLDLTSVEKRIAITESKLRLNGASLITARSRVQALTELAGETEKLKARESELSELFDGELVKAQGRWAAEQGAMATLAESVGSIRFDKPVSPEPAMSKMTPEHDALFMRIRAAQDDFRTVVDSAEKQVIASLGNLRAVVGQVKGELDAEFQDFKRHLDEALEKSGETSLARLRRELETVQTSLSSAEMAAQALKSEAQPEYDRLYEERAAFLSELKDARDDRRILRRSRVDELNKKMSGFVKIDIPSKGDTADFRQALEVLKVGSNLRGKVLDAIAGNVRPYSLVRAIWSGDISDAGALPNGVSAADVSRLHTNVADRDLWQLLLDMQFIETPDVLNVKFRKPEGQQYTHIEDLSHGQKSTAILVILLADGENPVLIDQPEDALHAPWIEEYLVDRLRELRGTRQYMFATRSPGLVVSADSEQLITMHATADKGEVEASGSLERHDLNRLALHHLEGGKAPFERRTRKLETSLTGMNA
jgi:PHP domain/AAA domain